MKRLLSAVALLAVLAGGAPSWAVSIDSNDKLLVQSNNTGTPGTFLDTSSGAKTVTTVGGATQIPFKINRTAIFTTNSGNDYVHVPDHADWDIGTGDFSLNFFIMFRSLGNFHLFAFDDGQFTLDYYNSGPTLRLELAGSVVKNEGWTPAINTWYHVVVDRNGTNLRMFVDGVQLGTPTTNAGSITTTVGAHIGSVASGTNSADAWFKEVRFSNVSRYTANFTPPTDAYTSDANTKLLLHGDSAATFPLSPWIKVDGTGDYMTIPDAAWQDLGTGDFTVEAVVRFNSLGDMNILDIGDYSTGVMLQYSNGVGFNGYVKNTDLSDWSGVVVANRNYHIAMVRYSGTVYFYLDGKLNSTTIANSSDITGLTTGVTIGARQAASNLFNGWMRNVRISNIARYTAAFTPPTAQFTSDANTMFLLHGNAANGSTTMTDSSSNAATITVNGDTKIDFQEDWRSTIITDSGNTGHKPYVPVTKLAKVDFVSVFGNGSGLFDGSGDRLTLADSADWDFGTGAFTLETWARFDSNSSVVLIDVGAAVSGTAKGVWMRNTGTNIESYVNSTDFNFPFVPAPNTWYHLAVSRSGTGAGQFKGFANGSLLASNTSSGDITGSTEGVTIGKASVFASGEFDGYLDNMRVSNVARYTATFDPADSDFSSGRKRSTVLF